MPALRLIPAPQAPIPTFPQRGRGKTDLSLNGYRSPQASASAASSAHTLSTQATDR